MTPLDELFRDAYDDAKAQMPLMIALKRAGDAFDEAVARLILKRLSEPKS